MVFYATQCPLRSRVEQCLIFRTRGPEHAAPLRRVSALAIRRVRKIKYYGASFIHSFVLYVFYIFLISNRIYYVDNVAINPKLATKAQDEILFALSAMNMGPRSSRRCTKMHNIYESARLRSLRLVLCEVFYSLISIPLISQ